MLYIYTGWGDGWKDPDTEKTYYTKGPGLSYDAAKYIESKAVVLVALDNPFTDPVAEGFLQGKAAPPAGVPAALPFAIHHHNLVVAGIHNIQNANLGELAKDKVWLSCTIILPLRIPGRLRLAGAAGGDRRAGTIGESSASPSCHLAVMRKSLSARDGQQPSRCTSIDRWFRRGRQ